MVYIAGSENVVADALSQIYSNDSAGTVRARSEYTYHDIVDDDTTSVSGGGFGSKDNVPMLAGIEARIATRRSTRVRWPTEKVMAAADSSVTPVETVKKVGPRTKSHSAPRGYQTPRKMTEGGSIDKNALSNNITSDTSDNSPSNLNNHDDTPAPEPSSVVPEPSIVSPEPAEGTLLNIVSQSLQGLDLLVELKGKYGSDIFFRSIINKPNDFRNFEVKEQLIYLKKEDTRVLCIPKIEIQGRSVREIVIAEAHSMLAHLGASKTLDYL